MLEAMSKHNTRNYLNRLNREVEHNRRATQERSKTIVGFPFVSDIDVYFYSGNELNPHKEYIVYFTLNNPVLIEDFKKVLNLAIEKMVIKE